MFLVLVLVPLVLVLVVLMVLEGMLPLLMLLVVLALISPGSSSQPLVPSSRGECVIGALYDQTV